MYNFNIENYTRFRIKDWNEPYPTKKGDGKYIIFIIFFIFLIYIGAI